MDTDTVTNQLVGRIKSWLAVEMRRRFEIAASAGINEKTIRLSASPDWDPRASTLSKLEAVMPASKPKKRGRAA